MADIDPKCPDSPYIYCPSLPAAVVFTVLFFGVTAFSFFQFFRLKTWFFYWMLVALICEVVGMASRAANANMLDNLTSYIVSYFTVVLAPSIMAASCYMAFGRLVWYITPHSKLNFKKLWIPPRWITPIFVTFDVVTFLIQVLGIGRIAAAVKGQGKTDVDMLKQGLNILRLGLILQMFCFGLFGVVGIHFLIVSRQWVVPMSRARKGQWQRLNLGLNLAATLITLRAFYRIFEFSSSPGKSNSGAAYYLYSHEWPFYVLDCLPIIIAAGVVNWFHPGDYLPDDFTRFRLIKKNVRRAKQYEEQGWPANVTNNEGEQRYQTQPHAKTFDGHRG